MKPCWDDWGVFQEIQCLLAVLIPLLEVKRTLLRLDHCTGDLKVHLTKIPCKTNGTLLLLTLEGVKPRCLTRLLFYNVVGSFQSWWFPAGILLRMDHESVLYRDILGFHQWWRLEENTRCLSIIRDNIFSSWEPSLCNQDFFFWSCSMLLERVLGRILYSVLICKELNVQSSENANQLFILMPENVKSEMSMLIFFPPTAFHPNVSALMLLPQSYLI